MRIINENFMVISQGTRIGTKTTKVRRRKFIVFRLTIELIGLFQTIPTDY